METLPAELVVTIVAHLDRWPDVLNCALVNKRCHRILRANATRLARPPAGVRISKLQAGFRLELSKICVDNNGNCNNVSINGNTAAAVCLCNLYKVQNLTLKSAAGIKDDGDDCWVMDSEDQRVLTNLIRFGRQRRIRRISMEKIYFDNAASIFPLFAEIFCQRECQRIQLRNCCLRVPWKNFAASSCFEKIFTPDKMESLAQLEIENSSSDRNGDDNDEASSSSPTSSIDCLMLLSVQVLRKFAWDLRHRLCRHPTPLTWVASLPEVSAQMPECREQFMAALCQFIENWLYNSDAPLFRISICNCTRQFGRDLCARCASQGITQMFMQFPSRAHRNAYITGKYNQEKHVFELFPVQQPGGSAGNAISLARFHRGFRQI